MTFLDRKACERRVNAHTHTREGDEMPRTTLRRGTGEVERWDAAFDAERELRRALKAEKAAARQEAVRALAEVDARAE